MGAFSGANRVKYLTISRPNKPLGAIFHFLQFGGGQAHLFAHLAHGLGRDIAGALGA